MPSWETHRRVGELICGFFNSSIDSLVDYALGHDLSRCDVDVLIESIERVYADYGEKGLCYFVLHHYLDRAADILVSEITEACNRYVLLKRGEISESEIEKAYSEIKENLNARLRGDPKNLLSLFLLDQKTALRILCILYKRGRRRKAWENKLKAVHSKMAKYKRKETVRSVIQRVLKGISEHLDRVIFLILMDIMASEPATLRRICNSLRMKIASYEYRYGESIIGSTEDLTNDISIFIERLIEYSRKEAEKP